MLCNDFTAKPWSQGTRGRDGDENAEFMSVMFEGHFNGTGHTDSDAGEPTQEQLLAALMLWRVCAQSWGWEQDDLYGHYHFGKPACPGYTGSAVIEAFRMAPMDGKFTKQSFDTTKLDSVLGRQEALTKLGYLKGEPDGVWGPVSKGALISYQRAEGLLPDGVWGKITKGQMVLSLKGLEDG